MFFNVSQWSTYPGQYVLSMIRACKIGNTLCSSKLRQKSCPSICVTGVQRNWSLLVFAARQFHLWYSALPGMHFSLHSAVGSVLDFVRMRVAMQLMQQRFFARIVGAVRNHLRIRWSVPQPRFRGSLRRSRRVMFFESSFRERYGWADCGLDE